MGQLFFTRWTAEPGRFESAAEVLFLHCPEPVLETEKKFFKCKCVTVFKCGTVYSNSSHYSILATNR